MSQLEYRHLAQSEIDCELLALPYWNVVDGKLERTFAFQRYQEGLVFATAVGFVADLLDHHPDIRIGHGKVCVSVNTHSIDGLSPFDFELARRVEALIA